MTSLQAVSLVFWISMLPSVIVSGRSAATSEAESGEPHLEIKKQGNRLAVDAEIPDRQSGWAELRIVSDRNRTISRFRDVSTFNPSAGEERLRLGAFDEDVWYPAVDLEIDRDMEGVAEFSDAESGIPCVINGPLQPVRDTVTSRLSIPAGHLQHWENSIHVASGSVKLLGFHLRTRVPVITGRIQRVFRLLSPHWSGTIELRYAAAGGNRAVSARIDEEDQAPAPFEKGTELDRQRLITAIKEGVGFTLRSQVKDPLHSSRGGLFLFYDLDARLYRSYHWVWGWGPSVAFLLRASELEGVGSPDRLLEAARQIGKAGLRFLWRSPGSPLDGMVISRWDRGLEWKDGYVGAITPADALFLAAWAWIPLFEKTAERTFLEAAARQCEVTLSLMQGRKIIPHSFYFDNGRWSNWVIDETGFGMEAFAEIHRVTGQEAFRQAGKQYIGQHLDVFERPDGLWDRQYNFAEDRVTPCQHMTRGLGWALEGLLAADRLLPGLGFRERAERMADQVLQHQQADGGWHWRFDRPLEEVGYGEKATALWSYLLYRLYATTGTERYRDAARRALVWCLNHLYDGPDSEAYGSIVGVNPQSGVGYRRWFPVSCTYTTAFAGLAALEELALQEAAAGKGSPGLN